jgi:DNA-binding GntR family transcriptional regulator
VEREKSEKYSISRTPVREILRPFVSDGFIELQQGKGYSVIQLSLERIVKVFQAREAVEGMVAYLSCL